MREFQRELPCHSTELGHFRKRIGKEGVEKIFQMSVSLHGELALEDTINIDTTVHEKNITYPTDDRCQGSCRCAKKTKQQVAV